MVQCVEITQTFTQETLVVDITLMSIYIRYIFKSSIISMWFFYSYWINLKLALAVNFLLPDKQVYKVQI